jgi:hypothetical protein
MAKVYGQSAGGGRTGGYKITAIGINHLVKLAKQLEGMKGNAVFRFRELNKQLKPVLMQDLKYSMVSSCHKKAGLFASKAKGLQWVGNTLDVIPGGVGSGISGMQVIVTDKNAAKFAKIYDTGGVIVPKGTSKYLAVATWQLKKGATPGVSLGYSRDVLPKDTLSLFHARNIKTVSIPLKGAGDRKLIIGKFPGLTSSGTKFNAQIPLFLLTKSVTVTPTHWASDGMKSFIHDFALPKLTKAARHEFTVMAYELGHGS